MPRSALIVITIGTVLLGAAVVVTLARKDPFEVFCRRVAAARSADAAGWRQAVIKIVVDMAPYDNTRATLKVLEYRSFVPFLSAIRSLGAVALDKHSEVFEHAAHDAGMAGWSCPAFADYSRAVAADLAQRQAAAEKAAAPNLRPEEIAPKPNPTDAYPGLVVDRYSDFHPGCDPKVIAGYVKKNLRAIQACYEWELRGDPSLKGKVVVKFTIGATGRVSDVEVVENTFKGEEVGVCVRDTIRKWVFPIKDAECPVEYPFVFTPAS